MQEIETPTTEIEPRKNWSLLASEQFGTGFHGEVVEEPNPEPQPEPEPAAEEVPQEAETQETEQQADQENQVEEVPISSTDQLIEASGYDPEWFNNLKTSVKVDGEIRDVSFADLRNSYQIQQAAEKRLSEAKEKSKAAHQVFEQKQQELDQGFNVLATLIEEAERGLQTDVSKINWEELRKLDPAEYTAQRQEFAEKQAYINGLKSKAIAQYQEHSKKVSADQQEQIKALLVEEGAKLIEKVPEWKSDDVAKRERAALSEFLSAQGFTPEELSAITDHRLIVIARKAMLHDKSTPAKAAAEKKVLTIPKVIKPGTPPTPEQRAQSKLNEAKAKLSRTGSLEDALDLYRMRK